MRLSQLTVGTCMISLHVTAATVPITLQKIVKDRALESGHPGYFATSVRSYVPQLPGKRARGIGISASLLHESHVNEALPAVTVRINGF